MSFLSSIAKTVFVVALTTQTVSATYSMVPGKGCGTQTEIKILETIGGEFSVSINQ